MVGAGCSDGSEGSDGRDGRDAARGGNLVTTR